MARVVSSFSFVFLSIVFLLGVGACQPTVTSKSPEGSSASSSTSTATTSNAVALDITAAFPGSGSYSELTGALTAASVCTGQKLFGSNGTAVCQLGSTSAAATTANVLTGKDFWDTTGAKVTGTMAVGADVAGTNAQKVITITAGFYDGTKTATASDANLTAGNIANGVSIFGVAGSASLETHSNCSGANQSGCVSTASFKSQSVPGTPAATSNVLANKEFYVGGALQTGSMAVGSNINGADGSLIITITEGYYDGTKTTTASDTDLVAANVCTTKNIFGTAGSAVCQSGSTSTGATAADIISGQEAWNNSGTKLTGTLTNQGNLNVLNAWPGAGYYGASPSNAPIASQLCTGTSVLGVSGSGNCSGVVLASNMHRDKATSQITQNTESITNAATVYTNADPGYRAIPKISKDDDGYTGVSVTYVDRTGWAGTTCGTSGTLAARIADCVTVFGANATWDGATNGNTGQGVWKLVTRTGAVASSKGREVWQDQRTMLNWSSLVSTSLNWCKASGSNNIGGNPAAEDDPSNYCDSATYQNTAGQAVSACFEDDGTNFTQTDAGIDSAGKGGLNRTSTPVVGWRLPTIYDFEQANINGIRFVMPDMGPASLGYEWSASVFANNRNIAWIFHGANGVVNFNNRYNTYGVRCVGR